MKKLKMCLVALTVVAAICKKLHFLFKKEKNIVTSKAKSCTEKLEACCDSCT